MRSRIGCAVHGRAAMAMALFASDARAQTMTFVMDPFPPFTYEEDGKAAGPMSDTIRAVCDELRLPASSRSIRGDAL
jgi:hypothetical protein